ncbi:hypothetical protein FRX31_023029 [Thalictrum thalictroides]|uniref:Uncharacterized protein n=1 Tax=Thalictrum thalictroides TaxID=46969 RepID=A0A7J6VQM2_THATH|nr:hypothetical protein FRX31_023029 [Thalictrum thalictroides]
MMISSNMGVVMVIVVVVLIFGCCQTDGSGGLGCLELVLSSGFAVGKCDGNDGCGSDKVWRWFQGGGGGSFQVGGGSENNKNGGFGASDELVVAGGDGSNQVVMVKVV